MLLDFHLFFNKLNNFFLSHFFLILLLLIFFSLYDKKGSKEFSSLVTVSANPPVTCYGSGFTAEIANEDAANNALKTLFPLHLEHDGKLNKAKKYCRFS